MASRRSTRGGPPQRPTKSGFNAGPLIAGVVLVGVIAVVVVMAGKGEEPTAPPTSTSAKDNAAKAPAGREPAPAAAAPASSSNPSSKRGGTKPAGRPAPLLSDGDLSQARQLAAEAKQHLNAAKRAKLDADHQGFKQEISACWEKVNRALAVGEKLRDWDEEADFESWIIASDAATQLDEINRWEQIKGEAHKLKPRG
jgi:hypothetical protein